MKDLDPYNDPTSIGNLAIVKGYATPEQVKAAVKKQEQRMPLGEILVEDKVLSREQLEELLLEQKLMRAESEHQATKMILRHQRKRIKEVGSALQELTCVAQKFVANGKA